MTPNILPVLSVKVHTYLRDNGREKDGIFCQYWVSLHEF